MPNYVLSGRTDGLIDNFTGSDGTDINWYASAYVPDFTLNPGTPVYWFNNSGGNPELLLDGVGGLRAGPGAIYGTGTFLGASYIQSAPVLTSGTNSFMEAVFHGQANNNDFALHLNSAGDGGG